MRAKELVRQLEVRRQAELTRCTAGRETLLAEHASRMRAQQHAAAEDLVRGCAQATKDPAFVGLLTEATAARLRASAMDTKQPTEDRLRAASELRELSAEAYAGMEKVVAGLHAQIDRAADAQRKAALAERRSRGVSIGMTPEDALQSSWGKPDVVNRTTYGNGYKEQWVYRRSGSYLYFENGVLTAISN